MAKSEKWSRDGSRAAGFRSLRLEELFREEMNSLLDGEVTDPRLEDTHVTRVELSRDGSRARIWFTKTARGAAPDVETARAAFDRAAGFFRSRLCDALSLKRMPELRFRHDPAAIVELGVTHETAPGLDTAMAHPPSEPEPELDGEHQQANRRSD